MKEGFPLLRVETDEDVDELLEGGRVARVSELGLREAHHVVPGEGGAAVAAEHRAHLLRAEGAELVHREDGVEAGAEGVQLTPDPGVEHVVLSVNNKAA